jgi:hypothetical protein
MLLQGKLQLKSQQNLLVLRVHLLHEPGYDMPCVGCLAEGPYVLSRDLVTIGWAWICNKIYSALATRNYTVLTVLHTRSSQRVFTSRCLVAASNGGRSPSSGFPNCLRP